jgi:trehalose 6-phosphate synthase
VQDAGNFERRAAPVGVRDEGGAIRVVADDGSVRTAVAKAYPISIDTQLYDEIARRPEVQARAKEIRRASATRRP